MLFSCLHLEGQWLCCTSSLKWMCCLVNTHWRRVQHVDETMSHYVATLCRRNLVLTRFTAHFTNTLLTKGLLTKGEAEELSWYDLRFLKELAENMGKRTAFKWQVLGCGGKVAGKTRLQLHPAWQTHMDEQTWQPRRQERDRHQEEPLTLTACASISP